MMMVMMTSGAVSYRLKNAVSYRLKNSLYLLAIGLTNDNGLVVALNQNIAPFFIGHSSRFSLVFV